MTTFVPDGFDPPRRLETDGVLLVPLGPDHNERDYAAWTSSTEHIHRTPGFEEQDWPHEMSLEENLDDLRRHARDFTERRGFTFTVLDPAGEDVVGCVYIYPVSGEEGAADVRSWVRADRAELDAP